MIFYIIYIFIILFCAVVCFSLGRYIAQGKGDSLIAGYGTESKEKQAEYDVVRLRRLVSAQLYFMSVCIALFSCVVFLPEQWAKTATLVLVLVPIVSVVCVTLWGNRWVKRK